jgi:hypothetical protein
MPHRAGGEDGRMGKNGGARKDEEGVATGKGLASTRDAKKGGEVVRIWQGGSSWGR